MKIIRNYQPPKLKVLVFGATGLVGKELIEILKKDDRYDRIVISNRRRIGYTHERIHEVVVDFDNLKQTKEHFKVDQVFICLGTTIKKAGSQQQFEKVDLFYPIEIAKIAALCYINTLVHVSALGADKNASNFYLRTKGKVEEGIEKHGPRLTFAVQPSMLFGKREEKRIGENIGKFLMKKLEFLMIGKLKKYRGIEAKDVASAMIEIANKKPNQKRIPSEQLKVISKYNSSK